MTNLQSGLRPVFQSFRENATIRGVVTHLKVRESTGDFSSVGNLTKCHLLTS